MYKIISLILCAIMVLSFAACKETTVNDVTESTTSSLQPDVQSSASSDNNDNQNTSSGIETLEDVFNSDDITNDTMSDSTVSDNSQPTNQSDANNSSQEDIFGDDIPESDVELELPIDKFN